MTELLSSIVPSQSVSTNSVMTQKQNVNIPEKDEIWSKILKNVASSKIIPTKNLLILGEPGVGKSTLVHYLKNDPGPQQVSTKFENDPPPPPFMSTNNHQYTQNSEIVDKNDLALSYSFLDVKDDENEAIARLGLYQLGLSSPEFLPLLKFAIRSETIADSCVLILLDWTRPWKFLETLERWINVLNCILDNISKEGMSTGWSKGKAILDELKEKLEHYIQTYSEPSGIIVTESISTSSTTTTTTTNFTPTIPNTTTDQVMLPLSSGCLTSNPSIPLIIVCCKSDAMNKLEQTHDYQDDQFDFIQQTLRCVALKYGAALFYTSTLYPYTYHNLREYILHRVLSTSTKSYPFHIKAQVIERDMVLVPSGWDSWGKIKILRETFDCESMSEGWDEDMAAVIDRQNPGNAGARGIYEECISNGELVAEPLNAPTAIVCEDEQSFYDRYFDKLQKNTETSYNRNGTGNAPMPMSPTTIQNMIRNGSGTEKQNGRKKDPSLEKLLMKGINNNTKSNGHLSPLSPAQLSITTNQNNNNNISNNNNNNNNNSTSPTSATVGQNAPSHEVLANFFQSLLKNSSGGTSSPTSIHSPNSMLNGGGGSRKDMDSMRQYTVSK